MAKRVDPLKAKEAKQKKMAIGLGVLLVAVLAFQGPKTLKMLKGPQAAAPVAAATAPTTPTTPAAAPAAAGAPVPAGAPAPAPGSEQHAVLVDSDVPAAAADGQLRSFELFTAKDPFAPQGGVEVVPGAPGPQAPDAPGAKPADGSTVVPPSPSPGDSGSGGSAPPAAAPVAAPASATSISVNGTAADVAVEATFPEADPAFVLVSLAEDGKSVQIGVAGGIYADGAKTITLTLGKPLTLRNTADGARYELELLTVAGFVPPRTGK